jgi:hypothetical protein
MKKKTKSKAKNVKLIRYSVKAIIPTGAYANIQPEIVVEADSLISAEAFVFPYIEKLFAKYRESPTPIISVNMPSTTTSTWNHTGYVKNDPPAEKPTTPNMSQSFNRASQAVTSCMSLEALELIKNQITKSVKLTENEKTALQAPLLAKLNELKSNENNIPKQ